MAKVFRSKAKLELEDPQTGSTVALEASNGSISVDTNPILTNNGNTDIIIGTDGNTDISNALIFTKTGGTDSKIANAILTGEKEIGNITFQSSDSKLFKDSVKILVSSDGPTSTNNNPGRLSIFTKETNTLTERMRIDKKGFTSFGYDWTSIETDIRPEELLHLQDGNLVVRSNQSNNTNVSKIMFERSFDNTDGKIGSDASNDGILGSIVFKSQKAISGDSGENFKEIASITSSLDKTGTLSSTNLPGSLNFSTRPSDGQALVETLRLTSNGKLLFRDVSHDQVWSSNFEPTGWSGGGWIYSNSGEPYWQSNKKTTYFKLVGRNTIESLTNKSFNDGNTFFFNSGNIDHKFKFDCSSLSGSITFKVPNDDQGTLVTNVSRLSNLLLKDTGTSASESGKLSIKWDENDSDTTRTLGLKVNGGNRTLDLANNLAITSDNIIKINSNDNRLKLDHDLSGGIVTDITSFEAVGDTTKLANHLSTKAYIDREVDLAKKGLQIHDPCRVGTVANISADSTTLVANGEVTFDSSNRTITLGASTSFFGGNVPAQNEDIIIIQSTPGGNWTYDQTGGSQEKLWNTSTTHGLTGGDIIQFTIDGGGAEGYNINTDYYVKTVHSITSVTLSLTSGGNVQDGINDSSGNWKAVKKTSIFDNNNKGIFKVTGFDNNKTITVEYSSGQNSLESQPANDVTIIKADLKGDNSTITSGTAVVASASAKTLTLSSGQWNVTPSQNDIIEISNSSTSSGGNWTYDQTGGSQEKLWNTSTTHGLTGGDIIQFTIDGGGAEGYNINTDYYVKTVHSTTSVTLSLTSGGNVQDGINDSSGNWKAVKKNSNNGKFKVSQATSTVITITEIGTTLSDQNSGTMTIHRVFSIDGVEMSINDRILVKNQTDKTLNGIYNVSNVGSISSQFQIVRDPKENSSGEMDGQIYSFIQSGNVNGGSSFVFTQTNPVFGLHEFEAREFTKTGDIGSGDGISYDNTTSKISINRQAQSGLFFDSADNDKVAVDLGKGLTYESNKIKLNLADTDIDTSLLATKGGTGQTGFTLGNILYASSTTELSKLLIGTSGSILSVSGTIPSWINAVPATSGGTGITSYSQGDMLYYDSGSTSTLKVLSKGGANKVLKMNDQGTVPEWGSVIDTLSNLSNISGNQTLDMSSNKTFILSLSGNIILTSPNTTGTLAGQTGSIVITTNSSSRTLSWGTNVGWYFENGIPLDLSNQNTIDVFNYIIINDSTNISERKILVTKSSNFMHYN